MTDQHPPLAPQFPDSRHAPQAQPPQGYAPQAPPEERYAAGAFPSLPSTGIRHWAWQLLYWVPLPVVPLFVVPLVLLGVRGGAVRNGGADEANSRAAMNWSLTWLIAVLATATLHFGMLFALTNGGAVSGSSPQGVVLAITASLFGLAFVAGGILTLINVIRGWMAAGRGEAARPWLAVPFLRAAPRATGA